MRLRLRLLFLTAHVYTTADLASHRGFGVVPVRGNDQPYHYHGYGEVKGRSGRRGAVSACDCVCLSVCRVAWLPCCLSCSCVCLVCLSVFVSVYVCVCLCRRTVEPKMNTSKFTIKKCCNQHTAMGGLWVMVARSTDCRLCLPPPPPPPPPPPLPPPLRFRPENHRNMPWNARLSQWGWPGASKTVGPLPCLTFEVMRCTTVEEMEKLVAVALDVPSTNDIRLWVITQPLTDAPLAPRQLLRCDAVWCGVT